MVEEWRRRHLRSSASSDLELPLYSSVSPSAATSPSQSDRLYYIPPSFSTPRAIGVFDSDDAFKYVATSMLLLYENHKLSVEDSIKGILIPEERGAFTAALHYRFSRLPVFPEPGESSIDGLVRRIHGIFGATLDSLPDVRKNPNDRVDDVRQPERGLHMSHYSNKKTHLPQHYQPPATHTMSHTPRRPSPLKQWLYDTREDENDWERPRSARLNSRHARHDGKSPKTKLKQKGHRTGIHSDGEEYGDVPKSFMIRPSGSRQARQHFFPESPHKPQRDPPGYNHVNSPIRVNIDWNIAMTHPNQQPVVTDKANQSSTTSGSANGTKVNVNLQRNYEDSHSHAIPNEEMSRPIQADQLSNRIHQHPVEMNQSRRNPNEAGRRPAEIRTEETHEVLSSPRRTTHTVAKDDIGDNHTTQAMGSPDSLCTQVTAKTKTTSNTDQSIEQRKTDRSISSNIEFEQRKTDRSVGSSIATEQHKMDRSVSSTIATEQHKMDRSVSSTIATEQRKIDKSVSIASEQPKSVSSSIATTEQRKVDRSVKTERSVSSSIASAELHKEDRSVASNTELQIQMSWEVGQSENNAANSRQESVPQDNATATSFMSWVSQAFSFARPASTDNATTKISNSSTVPQSGTTKRERTQSKPVETQAAINAQFQLEIARRKGALWHNEAEAFQRQSVLWQDISDEICDVMVKIQNSENDIERQAYESYLEELQTEMQRWTAAAAANDRQVRFGSTNLRNDSMDEGKSGDRYSITQNHSDQRLSPSSKLERVTEPQVALIEPSFEKTNRVVSVMAPRALPEGYKFEARIGHDVFLAKVPRGGVAAGEVFASRMYSVYDEDNYPDRGSVFKDMDTPDARWRDELFDCFHHGFLHPFLLNTIFCPQVALVQVMSRVQISCTGDKVIKLRARSRARNVVLFTLLVVIVHVAYFVYPAYVPVPLDHFLIATMPLLGVDIVLLFYFLYMVAFTRGTIRREFGIAESRCRGCEDACLAVFCTCCTIGQMGRHTADYETYRSYCCTDTGLAKHIEVMV